MKKIIIIVLSFVFAIVSFSKELSKGESVSIPIRVQVEVVEPHKVSEEIKVVGNKILVKDKKTKVMAINKKYISDKKNQIHLRKNDLNKKIIEVDIKI